MKSFCASCDGHVECDQAMAGDAIACPHCGDNMFLLPTGRPVRPTRFLAAYDVSRRITRSLLIGLIPIFSVVALSVIVGSCSSRPIQERRAKEYEKVRAARAEREARLSQVPLHQLPLDPFLSTAERRRAEQHGQLLRAPEAPLTEISWTFRGGGMERRRKHALLFNNRHKALQIEAEQRFAQHLYVFQGANVKTWIGFLSILGWGFGLLFRVGIVCILCGLYFPGRAALFTLGKWRYWRDLRDSCRRNHAEYIFAYAEREYDGLMADKELRGTCTIEAKDNPALARELYIRQRSKLLLNLIAAKRAGLFDNV